ncbi:Gfo/Idh/MocA family protein [Runella salmonicolor]|uniref:Gfo/Idh/MocA family oxidoreductase n=1 Tax=Runella salmonicolor TaxID=2950278 RepID=A0ABT1FPQ5_9BACT|nr:Gfo/Idh/MocA family oxidoreductase [Runella salmonicolor]MCP1383480.1 Gfo/Idh/MocA family oxidoreductase [Runella salmonicolor]
MNRRKFLEQTTQLSVAAGAFVQSIETRATNHVRKSANEKIVIGVIGCNNMGNGIMNHALNQPNVECAAICDIDTNIGNKRADEVMRKQGKRPQLYGDFRKLLENKDIDAVIIATPDHWHCLPMVEACRAGKDVYVEKPLANSIGECNVMVKAARRYNRVVQVGQQQRSGEHWQSAMQFIHSGGIGTLRKVHSWANFNYAIGSRIVPDEPVPAHIDFNQWLGPAPLRTYNRTRHHGSWRFFWDYGGGLMTDWGAHLLDIALWAKNIKTPPLSVAASGGNFYSPDFAHEAFDTLSVMYQLPDYTISWEQTAGTQNGPYGRSYGLAFIGNDATLVIDRGGWELFPEIDKGGYKVPAIPKRSGKETHEEHVKNWLECIRTRKETNCPIENGRLVALYAHAGNIALRTNSRLEWNEAAQSFGKNKAANALITPTYRAPWEFPQI